MQVKPYFCPNCRSNRTKFKVITSYARQFVKDPISGEIHDMQEPVELETSEPTIVCLVCGIQSNEMRYIKQAEREPRETVAVPSAYN